MSGKIWPTPSATIYEVKIQCLLTSYACIIGKEIGIYKIRPISLLVLKCYISEKDASDELLEIK